MVHLLAAAGLPPLPVTALPAADDEHRGIHMRRWQERAPWQHEADGQGEPSRVARSEFTYEGSLQHEIGRDKPAVGCQQRPQQAGRNPVRRVRHNPERPAGQPDRGNSTATTRAPARTRCAVSAPSPAPMSNTSSPGRTAAALTTRAAHSSWSRCQPHARRDRPRADTTYRHCVDAHAPDRSPPPALRSIQFLGSGNLLVITSPRALAPSASTPR